MSEPCQHRGRTGTRILAFMQVKADKQYETIEIARELHISVDVVYAALRRLHANGKVLKSAPHARPRQDVMSSSKHVVWYLMPPEEKA